MIKLDGTPMTQEEMRQSRRTSSRGMSSAELAADLEKNRQTRLAAEAPASAGAGSTTYAMPEEWLGTLSSDGPPPSGCVDDKTQRQALRPVSQQLL
jgi:hypothetical protein